MSRLGTRIAKAERVAGRTCDVTWQAAYAADGRILQRARAQLLALAEGRELLRDLDLQARSDEEVMKRWGRQLGVREAGGREARDDLLRRVNKYAPEREHARTPVTL